MSVVEPGQGPSRLVDRVKDILLQPEKTWEVIDAEPATIGGLYKSYVIPLALIPAVCGLIGVLVFGYGGFGFSYRPSIPSAVSGAVVQFAATLIGVFVVALIIDALAPSFGGTKNQVQAFKAAAYSGTAAWAAGVFQLAPAALGFLGFLGLYGLYLLHKGMPRLMKAPEDKARTYTVVVIIVALAVSLIIGGISSGIMHGARGPFGMMGGARMVERNRGTLTMPGGGTVDLGELEAASKKMEEAAKRMEQGGVEATDPSVLKNYLPATIAGYGRTEMSSSSGGVGDLTGSSAVGTYSRGDGRFTLTVTDLGAAGALTAMAGAFDVKATKESEGRYEKVRKVGGRMTMESYDTGTHHGEYSVLVADRFMVQAEGDRVSIDELKAAVNAVGFTQLEQLASVG